MMNPVVVRSDQTKGGQAMTNNELSRKVLTLLHEQKKPAKFEELVKAIGVDARTVYKNLFYLEEHHYIQLSTSYPSEAVYPLIHLVRMRERGKDLVENPEKLERTFPLSDTSHDQAPRIPPELTGMTYQEVFDRLAEETEASVLPKKERGKWRRKIEDMKNHPLALKKISRPEFT
jgi:DNA-binding transcriptional ArsR family regulator